MKEKKFLSVAELCEYLAVSKSFVYKLSFGNILPKYCPSGKLVYFKLSEVNDWLEQHRVSSQNEIEDALELSYRKEGRCK